MKTKLFFLALALCFFTKLQAQLTSTNLPIVIITTTSTISDTQKQASIKIIDNSPALNTPTSTPKFDGMIGLKLKGGSSYPKVSYSIETWSAPFVNLDTMLLGMPSENDWVLLDAYVDRSLMRNVLSNNLHEKMGRYAPRMKHCELIIDNVYKGVFLFGEKIKKDSNRVDIATLNTADSGGDQLTGGYIFRLDNGNDAGWQSQYAPPYGVNGQTIDFQFYYPDPNLMPQVQKTYIKNYVDSFENALNAANFQDTTLGWRKYGASNSFVEYIIINELSKDNDAYRKNAYFYKDKLGKIKAGPLWSNELAWFNTTDCNSAVDTGWAYNMGAACNNNGKLPSFWWSKLTQDALFMSDLKCLYTQYRRTGDILDTTTIFKIIDSVATKLNANGAIARNFTLYPIWNVPQVNEPTPMALNHAEEIANIKLFIKKRLTWLDAQWFSLPCSFPNSIKNSNNNYSFVIFPNPTNSNLFIKNELNTNEKFTIEILNAVGQTLYTSSNEALQTTKEINVSQYTNGLYYIKITTNKGSFIQKWIKE